MKYWLVVLVSFGFGLMSGIPAFAGSAMHRQGLAESFGGFAGNSPVRVGVPTMRQPAAPGAPVLPHGVSPAARTAVTPVASEVGTRGEMTPATRSAGIRPVEPRMIVIDPSGGAWTLASTGSATAAPPVVSLALWKAELDRQQQGRAAVGNAAKTAGLVGGESRVAAPFVVENPFLVSRPPRTGFSITSDTTRGARYARGSAERGCSSSGLSGRRRPNDLIRARSLLG